VTAQALVAWAADGATPDSAAAACSASVNGATLTPVLQTLVGGIATCAWNATPALDHETLAGNIVVTDGPPAVAAPLPFTAPLGDLGAPTVHALGATGTWGALVNLRYTGAEESGTATAHMTVKRGTRTIARLDHGFFAIHSGKSYGPTWRAPTAHSDAAFT